MLINPLITSNQAWSGGLTSGAREARPYKNLTSSSRLLRYLLRGAFEELVDQSLIGLGLFGGEAAKLGEETRSDADGDELFGVAGPRPTDAAGVAELFAGRLRDIGEVDFAIRHRLGALCGSLGAR